MRRIRYTLLAALSAAVLVSAIPVMGQMDVLDPAWPEMEEETELLAVAECPMMAGERPMMAGECPMMAGERPMMGEMGMGGGQGCPLMAAKGGPAGCPMMAGAGSGPEMGGPGCCPGLDLTDEQKEQLRELKKSGAEEMFGMRNESARLHIDLRTLMLEQNPDRRKIDRTIDSIMELHTRMMKRRVDLQLRRREILTPEQWEQWRTHAMSRPPRGMRGGMEGQHRTMIREIIKEKMDEDSDD